LVNHLTNTSDNGPTTWFFPIKWRERDLTYWRRQINPR
jgi:hypothetical protein